MGIWSKLKQALKKKEEKPGVKEERKVTFDQKSLDIGSSLARIEAIVKDGFRIQKDGFKITWERQADTNMKVQDVNKTLKKLDIISASVEQLAKESPTVEQSSTVQQLKEQIEDVKVTIREEQIIDLLKDPKTAEQIALAMDLSRSRSVQILNDMEKRDLIVSQKKGKKKVFKCSTVDEQFNTSIKE